MFELFKPVIYGNAQVAKQHIQTFEEAYRNIQWNHIDHPPALVDLKLDSSNCIKCGLCRKTCPVGAIDENFVIDNAKCIKCNSCKELCPKKTIQRVPRGEGFNSNNK